MANMNPTLVSNDALCIRSRNMLWLQVMLKLGLAWINGDICGKSLQLPMDFACQVTSHGGKNQQMCFYQGYLDCV